LACAARAGGGRYAPRPRAVSGDHVRRPATFSGTVGIPRHHRDLLPITADAVLIGAALHFGAAIPLGIFTASAVSRLQFLGARAAGASIALFGEFAMALTMLVSLSMVWHRHILASRR